MVPLLFLANPRYGSTSMYFKGKYILLREEVIYNRLVIIVKVF